MRTLAEEYCINKIADYIVEEMTPAEKKAYIEKRKKEGLGSKTMKNVGAWYGAQAIGAVGAITAGAGFATTMATGLGASVAGVAALALYRKHKLAKAKADEEQDPAKKNKLNVQANQLKQDANKKKGEDQKKKQSQKQAQILQKQTIQKQAQLKN